MNILSNTVTSLLLLWQVLFPASLAGMTPRCAEPTEMEIVGLLSDHLGSGVTFTLSNYTISCLTSGGTRDTYAGATIIVNIVSNVAIEGCLPSAAGCTGFFHILCSDFSPTWILSQFDIAQILILADEADLTIAQPRIDCGVCSHDGALTPTLASQLYDMSTGCFACNPDAGCGIIGLGLCVGVSGCCNYYDNDCCVVSCPSNKFADESTGFNCVCTNPNLALPDCTECTLSCNNGTADSACTTCTCDPGYTGDDCSTEINECNSLNIDCNNGVCVDMINSYQCQCDIGYTGNLCDMNIDDCIGVDCNNGTCVDGIENFTCDCSVGYEGEFCEQEINRCLGVTCQNGGVCIDGINSSYCNCTANFNGTNCENCILDNCQNCSTTEANVCLECEGFYVPNGFGICECGLNCNNGTADSTCTECNCDSGYSGDNCSVNIDDCVDVICQNGGQCVDGINNYTCNCTDNFSGRNCEDCNIARCLICSRNEPNVCDMCMEYFVVNDFTGKCVPLCTNTSCVNGVCVEVVQSPGALMCQCNAGYTGALCEINIDECAERPCQNGGLCIDLVNDFRCSCRGNYIGKTCDQVPRDCTLPNCLNCTLINGKPYCLKCEDGYYKTVNGTCLEDLTVSCGTADNPNLCSYSRTYTTWEDLVGFSIPPSSSLDNANYTQWKDIFTSTRNSWAELASSDAFSLQVAPDIVPQGDTELEVWRLSCVPIWVADIQAWIDYFTSICPSVSLPSIPTYNLDTDPPEDIYGPLANFWNEIAFIYSQIVNDASLCQ